MNAAALISPGAMIATIRLNLLRRPLMSACLAGECLGVSRTRLDALIDSGALAWAWNLGRGHARKEIRILAACVVERVTGAAIPAIGASKNLNLPEVLKLILPQKRDTLRGVELQRLFSVGPDLIHDLHLCGELKKVAERLPAVGPNSSPRFTCDSIGRLLGRRRIV